jgi:hypothetical protein
LQPSGQQALGLGETAHPRVQAGKREPEIVVSRSRRDRLLQQGSRIFGLARLFIELGRHLIVEAVLGIALRETTRLVESRVQAIECSFDPNEIGLDRRVLRI